MSILAIAGGVPIRKNAFVRWPIFDERERLALIEVLESRSWGGYNSKIKEFEEAFAAFHHARYAASASNGTVTLEAALLAAGIGPGDEVIVPPITFIATATAALRVGATPVFADIGPDYNIDPKRVEEAISERTRAIIVVHFAGRPVDMDAIADLAAKHHLLVIEDAAHAHGAAWRGRPVGTLGDIASFSFQQSKNMTAGEGGMLIGNRSDLIEGARSIFNQGRIPGGAWYQHDNLGTNQRLTAWQAAVLLVQLQRLPEQMARRAENARYLDDRLRDLDFIGPFERDPRVTSPSYYLYMVRLRLDRMPGVSRDAFVKALAAEGIPGMGSYPQPIYENRVFHKRGFRRTDCPQAVRMCQESFWVSHEILLSERRDLDDFVSALTKVYENCFALCEMSVKSR